MPIPSDYIERVYAGVLGKIIGVYLGRPFEGWPFEKITRELGEINYYVHERPLLNAPLIVTDDDISGTFTFIRALEDHGISPELTAEQIGQSWLNYIIEKRTILWWGGMANSTEHTAFLRLKHGIPAPRSGSIETNSKVVAEQIGAQIFIDGWAMVAPGNAKLATDLARKAASVSHDGEASYGAQVVAAIESMAFVENDIDKLIDAAVGFIPEDSVIYRMIADLRRFREKSDDWRKAFVDVMQKSYGYDKFGGNCHMVPNHGIIILALLYGEDSFQKSLMIANTCGWDTDCNSGNVGCIMGIKNGLAGIDAGPDWRGPVADRMYLPTAEGGSGITDALTQAYKIANMGLVLAGEKPVAPKDGARYHFSMPGSVQGWMAEDTPEARGATNVSWIGAWAGKASVIPRIERSLVIFYRGLALGRFARAAVATFIPQQAARMTGYGLIACPTLYPGQQVRAEVIGRSAAVVACRLYIRVYGRDDQLERIAAPPVRLGYQSEVLEWSIPDTGGRPIAEIGVEVSSSSFAHSGGLALSWLTWSGAPSVTFRRPDHNGTLWQRAWVNAMDHVEFGRDENTYRLIHDEGRGMFIQGTREWTDYRVSAEITPMMVQSVALAARVQGLRRFYALVLERDGKAKLIKCLHEDRVLAELPFPWDFRRKYSFSVQVMGDRIQAWIDGRLLFDMSDSDRPLTCGGVALAVKEGRISCGPVSVARAT